MIERVAIAGTDLELLDVFAALTLRHGRGDVDDSPLGSTATLTLVNVTREFAAAFTVGAELELDAPGAVARFRGRITDAALDAAEATLSIIAVSSLARISGRKVGAGAWPAEAWSARVARVFAEADATALLELELGGEDPALAARAAEETTLGAELVELAETVASAVADRPDGQVLVQAVSSRQGVPPLELDPAVVAYAPEWVQADAVANVVRVEWDGGTVEETDATSVATFEERAPLTISTTLANLADAEARALLELNRRATPDWTIERAALLELELALGVGSPVLIPDLPPAAPRPVGLGIVEGWEDHIEPDGEGGFEWRMALSLSPARLSGYGVTWALVPAEITWATVDPAMTWAENEELLYV